MIVVAAKGGGKFAGVGAGEWGLDGGRRGVEQGDGLLLVVVVVESDGRGSVVDIWLLVEEGGSPPVAPRADM